MRYPDDEVTVTRGDESWSFRYSPQYHALELSRYSVAGESLFHEPAYSAPLGWDKVPLPDDVKAEALEQFNASLRVIRAWPEAAAR